MGSANIAARWLQSLVNVQFYHHQTRVYIHHWSKPITEIALNIAGCVVWVYALDVGNFERD